MNPLQLSTKYLFYREKNEEEKYYWHNGNAL